MSFLTNSGFWALLVKETSQLLRNKQLLFMLVIMPTIQIFLYGFALSPEVKHLRMGVIDYSQSPLSRKTVSAFIKNGVFDLESSGGNELKLTSFVRDGKLDVGVVIPPDFERKIKSHRPSTVQIILDGVDANTAGIATGYINQIIANLGSESYVHSPLLPYPDAVRNNATFIYNAGLVPAWFFVPGVIGMVLNIVGIMVSSATLLREKETGTLEQLLMTPVTSAEILVAKIVPLIAVLFLNVGVSVFIGMSVFAMPFRGNPLAFVIISLLYIFVVLAIGIALSTVAENQRQAMLISFFISLPVIQLSGAIAPLESMPPFFQNLSLFNPLRYYIVCLKGVLLKGVGLDILWPEILAIFCFAVPLLSLSAARFRKQLS
ncbi:MAG: ABC transporter permease [Candidatus Obscuribacterales bacterium]|nr:ABC transporter permease [Candidatus Obscuribacterales bacterium]